MYKRQLLGIKALKGLRLINRYDVEGIDNVLFQQAIPTVFSEPPVDTTYTTLPEAQHVLDRKSTRLNSSH